MKQLNKNQIESEANTLVRHFTCCVGGISAARVFRLAWHKSRAQNKALKAKYKGGKK